MSCFPITLNLGWVNCLTRYGQLTPGPDLARCVKFSFEIFYAFNALIGRFRLCCLFGAVIFTLLLSCVKQPSDKNLQYGVYYFR
jgi:hypothetical protein